ncbi:MAG TPA: glycosyltransferase family 2 protein [Salinivirgaceae bacterium]|nr:glycosyltransferase family 2 protein [Salinivirgaceae bacterium]
MVKISVVIITFNEEKNIGRCLESVQGLADEIVVLDSFSTDRTQEICESFGVRFFQHSFDGHIQQKNRVIGLASYPHILSLDADEVLSENLYQSILKVKENWDADGYYFNRLTNYCGQWIRHCGWYPDRKLRLWDSRKGRWGGVNPHDRFIMEPRCSVKFLKGDLLHFSYFSISQHQQQANAFSSIGAKADFEKGKRADLLKIWLFPKWKFFRDFILKKGFLDGYYGYIICKISAHATFLKYVKIRELQKNKQI